jgi:putative ABC transport system permease protein
VEGHHAAGSLIMTSPRPPVLAERLLRLIAGREESSHIVGDLAEEYVEWAAPALGLRAARRWYWRQVLSLLRPGDLIRQFKASRNTHRVARPVAAGLGVQAQAHTRAYGAELIGALRTLWRRPSFSLAVVLTLALGLGANTTIFSVVNGVLLRPLPYEQPERLVQVQSRQLRDEARPIGNSLADYLDLKDQNRAFTHLATYTTLDFNLPGAGTEPLPVRVNFASSDLFRLLGVPPHLGRTFIHTEERPGEDLCSVILSYDLWRRRFNADAATLGRVIKLDTTDYRVVGVMPPGFRFPDNADAWAPIESWFDRARRTMRSFNRNARGWTVVGRLRADVTETAARQDLERVSERLEREHPQTNTGVRFSMAPLRDSQISDIRPYLLPLLGAAGFVFLVSCVNVTNLLLARATERRKELAVRIALGASRSRVIQCLVAESVALALVGGVLGVLVSTVSVRALRASIPIDLPLWITFELDWRVLSYAWLLALAVGLVAGVVPAIRALHEDQERALKDNSRGSAGSRATAVGRASLVASAVAFSLLLLVGAGLMLRSFSNLQSVDPGFRPDGLLVVYVSPPGDRYVATPPLPAYTSLYQRIVARLQSIPGVEAAAGSRVIPYDGRSAIRQPGPVTLDGQGVAEQERNPLVRGIVITPDYFRASGIPLTRGRSFEERETQARPRVAIVNEALVRRFWPDADPIGKRIKPGSATSPGDWVTVVGVAGNVKYSGLHIESELTIYYPYTQASAGDFNFVVRTRGAPLDHARAVQREIWAVDPDLAIYSMRTMTSILASSLWQQRLWTSVLWVFAATAVALALVGIHGILAWSVRQRSRELGVRLALGATPGRVAALVLRQGMTLTTIGLVVGLLASVALTRTLSSLLFGITSMDPFTWIVVSVTLASFCAIACYVPARRAAAIDPIAALRQE